MSEDLKSCPWCKEVPKCYPSHRKFDDHGSFEAIECANEDCAFGPSTDYLSWPEAIKTWNTRASGWQDISTAPRDGTAVLVMRNIWPGTKTGKAEDCNGHNTYVSEWWEGEGDEGKWVCYMDMVRDPICPIDPTHWMALPQPPKTDKL